MNPQILARNVLQGSHLNPQPWSTQMKKSLTALAVGAAMLAGSAHASLINVGGVVWDPDSFLDFTTDDSFYETIVNLPGDVTTGFGRIKTLNGADQSSFCPGCELTYKFTGYTLAPTSTPTRFIFTGGTIELFVDNTPDWDATTLAGLQAIATTATNGTPWLSLAARTTVDPITGALGTLFSSPTPTATGIIGNGSGFLDVTGGLAAGNFDTNTFNVLDAPGVPGKADFQFSSSFQLLPNGSFSTGGFDLAMFGSNDLQGNSIPEPGSMALVGLGLVGLVAMRRTRKQLK